jgi:hypothetical protein
MTAPLKNGNRVRIGFADVLEAPGSGALPAATRRTPTIRVSS